jgi:hypothetical protein
MPPRTNTKVILARVICGTMNLHIAHTPILPALHMNTLTTPFRRVSSIELEGAMVGRKRIMRFLESRGEGEIDPFFIVLPNV